MEIRVQFEKENAESQVFWVTATADVEVFRCEGDDDTPSFLDFEYTVTEVVTEDEYGNAEFYKYNQIIEDLKDAIDYEIEKKVESKIL